MDNNQKQAENDPSNPSQPGHIITPGTSPAEQPQEAQQPSEQNPVTEAASEAPQLPDQSETNEPASVFPGNVDSEMAMAKEPQPRQESQISWVAPEFVEHDKSSMWYVNVLAITLIACGIFYVLSRDIVSAAMIVIVMVIVSIYTLRKPKNIQYELGDRTMTIGNKNVFYGNFRSFTMANEGNFISVTFIPMQRFAVPIGLCINPQDQDRILDFLADRLPLEKHNPDPLERLMLKIHF